MSNDTIFHQFIANELHYTELISRIAQTKHTLWIGTADIKDLYIRSGSKVVPLLQVLATKLSQGVEIRLIHAKKQGPAFMKDYSRFPILDTSLEQMQCPRVHFKMIIFDSTIVYLGSANLTGAAIGMKSPNRRNFECGILTNDPILVVESEIQFINVWEKMYCKTCGRKQYCK